MSYSLLESACVFGLDVRSVEVETRVESYGLPTFTIVGLADKSVEEAKERVRASMKSCGFDFPDRRIIVNLAPAEFQKRGTAFDVTIALSILLASGQVRFSASSCFFIGELSLDGRLREVPGIVAYIIFARDRGFKKIFVPNKSIPFSICVGIEVIPVETFSDLINYMLGKKQIDPLPLGELSMLDDEVDVGFEHIKGQEKAKRALEIACAGGHNVLFVGPPGSGKTLLARSAASILPKLSKSELTDVMKIHSIYNRFDKSPSYSRPFRSPHHTSSLVGLIGGGNIPKPGEISLAHRGVLFMDEFCELPKHIIDGLRQPMEDGFVSISRVGGKCVFPSKFMLIASSNPCPCGYYMSQGKVCKCSVGELNEYSRRLSGPIMDRIDLHLFVESVEVSKAFSDEKSLESSVAVRKRVSRARQVQEERANRLKLKVQANAELGPKDLKMACVLSKDAQHLLDDAAKKLKLSFRAYSRVLKVARTITDLDTSAEVVPEVSISEALQFRAKNEL